jgi:DNA-binding transcriptional MerR regulator
MTRLVRSKSSRPLRKRAVGIASAQTGQRPLKIGEAAQLVGVKPYVLRFWETQFPVLRPKHARSRHRFYEPSDIETLRLIKHLLHEERFTIAGAKKHMRQLALGRGEAAEKTASAPAPGARTVNGAEVGAPAKSIQKALLEIRRELESLQKFLEH